jgi:CRP-like cAMP-binding protein
MPNVGNKPSHKGLQVWQHPEIKSSEPEKAIVDLELFDQASSVSIWPAGVRLIEQGVRAQGVYLVLSGIAAQVYSAGGKKNQTVGVCLRGALLGVISSTLHIAEPVHVDAITPCRIRHYPAARFQDLIETDHRLSRSMRLLLSHQAYTYLSRIIELSSLSAKQHLETILSELVRVLGKRDKENGVIRLALPLRHRDLASLIAVTPEHLSRLLNTFEANGVFRRQNGWFIFPESAATTEPPSEER